MKELAAHALRLTRGQRTIIEDLSLSLRSGEVTVLVGPNGAGKSTLLECLAGLARPAGGAVTLGGTPLSAVPARARAKRIGYLEQTPQIAWDVDVRTLVGLGRTPWLGARGLTETDRLAVDAALQRAHLEAYAERPVAGLSGGERARVLIARVLAGDPDWLLADEPMAGLDPAHQLEAAGLFRRLAREGHGVLVTLHDLTLAARMADRVIVLSGGAILADGPPAAALEPAVLRQAYGVEVHLLEGRGGLVVDIAQRPSG